MRTPPEPASNVPDRSFCFVHAADLHLDTPFKGLHAIAPEIASALRDSSLDAFDAIVDLALERGAAFVLLAGDIYDGAERGLRAQLRFRDGLARLSDAGIESFVVHGNHDPVATGWSAITKWPERATVFPAGRVEVVPVVRGGSVLATVQGISYATQRTTENLARRLARPDGAGFHVGLLHANVQGAADGYEDYAPCTLEDLRSTRLDYVALGHIHQTAVLARGTGPGDPWVVYPGNSQARNPRPSERGPKGAMVVEIVDGAVASVEHVACDRVRFAEVERDVAAAADLPELEDRLDEGARDALAASDGRSLVLRARLVGRGSVHRDLRRPGALDELLAGLRDRSIGAQPFCWWDSLVDATAPSIDLEAIRGRGDFASDLLEQAALATRVGEGAADLVRQLTGGVPRSLGVALESLLEEPGALAGLVEEATLLALDALEDEGPSR